MKPKELSARTGLKERTIRFYVEAGLLCPTVERRNGRSYREYTEQDVETLAAIAALRRARFSLEDIRRMQQDPAAIREIFPQYRQWLLDQQAQLSGLLEAVEGIDPAAVTDYTDLSRRVEAQVRRLSLPPADLRPRFRYLDDLEERPPLVEPQTNLAEDGGNAGFWRLAMERKGGIRPVSYDDMLRGLGLADYAAELENGAVASRMERDGRGLRLLKGVYTAVAAVTGLWALVMLYHWGPDVYLLLPAALFGASLAFRLLLALVSWRRDRRGWLTGTLEWNTGKGGAPVKKIPYLVTLLLALLIAAPVGLRIYRLHQMNASYQPRADVVFQPTSIEKTRRSLVKWGVDTAMPGNGDQVLTFTSPCALMFRDTAYNDREIHRGDVLTSDFVSWSHDYFRERFLRLTVNGRTVDARLTTFQAARLYVAALRQNGLAEQFQADTGRRLSLFSAQRALRQLDQRLFEAGIFRAYDYPYDRRLEETFLALIILFAIPISVLLLAVLSTLGERVRYRLWLAAYNREHQADWDRVAGTLPQFVSLRESGLDRPVPQYKKRRLWERLRGMYG